jgi:PPM family protein phosphatase
MIKLRAGAATDVGLVRTTNQDELLMASPLFAVADGMGGPAAGEVAAATAIKHLQEAFVAAGEPTPDSLLEAAQAANRAVWNQAEANPEMRGMGTTLVALALVNDGRLAIINIGDSRLYVLHEGELRQITSDHNLVAELVAEGRLSKEEAEFHPRRNVITRAIGVDPEVPADLFSLDPVVGDRFLLCSDGLFRELSDDQIAALLRRLADPEDAAKELVT